MTSGKQSPLWPTFLIPTSSPLLALCYFGQQTADHSSPSRYGESAASHQPNRLLSPFAGFGTLKTSAQRGALAMEHSSFADRLRKSYSSEPLDRQREVSSTSSSSDERAEHSLEGTYCFCFPSLPLPSRALQLGMKGLLPLSCIKCSPRVTHITTIRFTVTSCFSSGVRWRDLFHLRNLSSLPPASHSAFFIVYPAYHGCLIASLLVPLALHSFQSNGKLSITI
jgi:hypothetical protein